MAQSSNTGPRRRRFVRDFTRTITALMPVKVGLLDAIYRYSIITSAQLTRLSGLHPKACQRRLRALFDTGLINIVPVARVALADPTAANDISVLFGSAPNIFMITKESFRVLEAIDLADGNIHSPPGYGPRNSMFLAHELAVRDVRVWLELSARKYTNCHFEKWVDGPQAEIALPGPGNLRAIRPDPRFACRFGDKVLVGLLELDRNTERGSLRWSQKLGAYGVLFSSGRLKEVTGYSNARVVVVTPDARRRDRLGQFVADHAVPALAERFWLAECSLITVPDLGQPGWRQPGKDVLQPLIPPELSVIQAV